MHVDLNLQSEADENEMLRGYFDATTDDVHKSLPLKILWEVSETLPMTSCSFRAVIILLLL